ncbi:DHA2 family efflux MFS transporter permease subunit [Streptosporangium sp. NPDC001681]|uniref:DHA2 family efflux MFS transporter permease subunit n=1 Tax=Streptosporangium sp. NPDC001681 TaxID=3154395 RepID=UPI00332816E5
MRSGDADAAYPWRVLSITSIGVMLAALNTSTMDVALPAIARHFDASPAQANWILLSYLLVNTSLILVFGRVADILGRRLVYLCGLALFTVAGLACGFAPDPEWLAALRGVQAVGGAALVTNVTALLADVFPVGKLATAVGVNVSVVSTAQLLGPVTGGALVEAFGWRSAFWFNVPIGIIGLVSAALVLRRVPRSGAREPFDVPGALLSALALVGLAVALSEGGSRGWGSPPVVAGAAGFVVFAGLFVLVERRRRHPLLDLGLFGDRPRAMALAANFLSSVGRYAVVLLVGLYLQAAVGMSPFEAGLHVMPAAIGLATASVLVGSLARRWEAGTLATGGLMLLVAGLVALALIVEPGVDGTALGACLVVVGVGTGLFMAPNTSTIVGGVATTRRGVVNGLRATLQQSGFMIGAALGPALATSLLTEPEQRAAYAGTFSSLPGARLDALTHGYRVAFWVLAALCLLAAAASVLAAAYRQSST